jgi:hypothetical protein
MGEASKREKNFKTAIAHLAAFGADLLADDPYSSTAAQWLQNHFVNTMRAASDQGASTWQNQVYLTAQAHPDSNVRAGLRALMNDILTCGLDAGRVVFALQADVQLTRPDAIGEFDTCEPVAQWVAKQLGVPAHNVRVRHSVAFVPARAGLFGLIPTLGLLSKHKALGELPQVATRKGTRDSQIRQQLTFLVSVFTSEGVELDHMTPAPGTAPVLELHYWGKEDETPVRPAQVTPLFGMQVFDALEMLGFWEQLSNAKAVLEPLTPASECANTAEPHLPVIQVLERYCADPRYVRGTELLVRWRDVEMRPVPVYEGSFAQYFIAQLDRLGVIVQRIPGILPAAANGPLFTPDGELTAEARSELDIELGLSDESK